jgi:hypothetical protein
VSAQLKRRRYAAMKSPYSTIMFLFVILCASPFAFSQPHSKLIEWQLKPMGSSSERWTAGTLLFKLLDRVEIEGVAVGNSITIGQSFKADDDG